MSESYELFRLESRDKKSVRTQMGSLAYSARKRISWKSPVKNLEQLGDIVSRRRRPYDDENINKDSSTDFIQFIKDLISSNKSRVLDARDILSIKYTSRQYRSETQLMPLLFLVDETDSFDFITCVTYDTFWSIAELFYQPYQPLVWIGLVVSLLSTVGVLIGIKIWRKCKFSVSKLVSCFLFNLIEVRALWK